MGDHLGAQSLGGAWTMAFNHQDGQQAGQSATDPYAGFPAGTFVIDGFYDFPTRLKAAHMALIPRGPHQGKVLVWDQDPVVGFAPHLPQGSGVGWSYQPYAIVDPRPTLPPGQVRFRNFLLPIGPVLNDTGGDIFCSGHCWTPFGDLVVVGGTDFSPAGMMAANKTFVFNPTLVSEHYPQIGRWIQGPDLQSLRWYPTATLTGRLPRLNSMNPQGSHAILVLGGSSDLTAGAGPGTNPTWNTYEAFEVIGPSSISPQVDSGLIRDTFTPIGGTPTSTFAGPSATFLANWRDESLYFYPRCHLLTTGRVFMGSFAPLSAAVDHDSVAWDLFPGHSFQASLWNGFREYGASVLYPNIGGRRNEVVRLGGRDMQSTGDWTTSTVEICDADDPSAIWTKLPEMKRSRSVFNVVVLPDASLIAFGGLNETNATNPPVSHFQPEILPAGSTKWHLLPPAFSVRQYHSAAVLLPDGRVLTGGGEERIDDINGGSNGTDYEVFSPPYLVGAEGDVPLRPTGVDILNPFAHDAQDKVDILHYASTLMVQFDPLPLGISIAKAVFMAPGSTTHHSDMHQRYHEVPANHISTTRVKVFLPTTPTELVEGFYMMFLVDSAGIPSEAVWVRIQ